MTGTRLYRTDDGSAWVLESDGGVTFLEVAADVPDCDCGHRVDEHGISTAMNGATVCLAPGCWCGVL